MTTQRQPAKRRISTMHRRRQLGWAEMLEAKLPLDASGFLGNDCAPNLDMSAVAIQTAQPGQELILNLFNAGATVVDLNADETPTNDDIVLQLDPDDNPAGATLTSDGLFTWTPPQGATGQFEFIVIAIDGGTPFLADAESFFVEISEDTPNTAPNLADVAEQSATVGQELVVVLSAADAENDNLTFQIDPEDQDLQTLGATLEQNGDTATLRWTPDVSFAGQSLNFIALVVDDGTPPMSDSESFTIYVANVAAAADAYAATAGSELVVEAAEGVLANDSIGNGSLTATLVEQATQGTVTLATDGSFLYVANAEASGTDSFTYQADDGNGNTMLGVVTINLTAAPVAADDAFVATEDTPLIVDAANGVLGNDTDADADSLTAVVSQAPASGSLTLNADGSFEYTPAADTHGEVTFTYVANDGTLDSNEATVTITIAAVNDAPVANSETYEASEDTQLGVAIVNGVLANDTDVDSDHLTVTLVSDVMHGSLTLSNDGSFIYVPEADFNGMDCFAYTVSDGDQVSAQATATIEVGAVNDAPVAMIDEYSVSEGSTLVINASEGVLLNDTDVDGDTLTASLQSNPFEGSLSFNADGSFTYTPDAGVSSIVDVFSYLVNDGTDDSNVAMVRIEIVDVNQTPVGVTDAYDVTEDVTLIVDAASGVLSNDTDGDGDTLTVLVVQPVSEGTLTLNDDGSFEYDASENSSGTDQFTYEISDGTTTSAEVTVTLNITTVNDAPVAVNDSYEVAFEETLQIAAPGVLDNDLDAEDDLLVVSVVDNPTDGTLTLNEDGSFTYNPDAGFSGNDSFTYEVSDGEGTDIGTVDITVKGQNEFDVSAAAAAGTVVGTVESTFSSPVVFELERTNFDPLLLLDETDHLSGDPTAPAVLIEYLDLGCLHCATAHPILEQLKQNFDGELLLVQRHFPVITVNSEAAARVAEAAGRQGMFAEMVNVLFDKQSEWVPEADPTTLFNQYANDLGLDMPQFAEDILDADLQARVADDEASGNALSLTGTPSFFLNGTKLDPTPSEVSEFTPLIQAEIDIVTSTSTYAINRQTGEIIVADPTSISDETLTVLVTDDQGDVESVEVTINAVSASSNGVAAAAALDDALAGEEDWLS